VARRAHQTGNFTGTLKEAVVGADVFIGVSAPGVIDGTDVAAMGTTPWPTPYG
jgi:malic enzyme